MILYSGYCSSKQLTAEQTFNIAQTRQELITSEHRVYLQAIFYLQTDTTLILSNDPL